MSRFPKITETFVLDEMLELKKLGFDVEVYPLMRERAAVEHPEGAILAGVVHFHPFLSPAVLAANWYYLIRQPLRYLATLARVLGGTFGSARFFLGAMVFFPKSVWLARQMTRRGITHVHAHFASHPALAALIVNRLTGIPFSFTAHGSDIHVELRSFDMKIEAAAFAVTVSQYNKQFLIDRFGEAIGRKLNVIHCGVDPDVFGVRPRGKSTDLRILCVASFRQVKGHRCLVEACRILKDRGVAFSCHLVGDGPLREKVEKQIAAAGLDGIVRLHGALPRPQVLGRLQDADVLVLPSIVDAQGRREGIPVTLMEAMACGLPVVASRISGIPELVDSGSSGILTPPGDPRAIADALEELARSPRLRKRLGRAARQKVRQEYNLRLSAAALAELLRGVGAAAPETFDGTLGQRAILSNTGV